MGKAGLKEAGVRVQRWGSALPWCPVCACGLACRLGPGLISPVLRYAHPQSPHHHAWRSLVLLLLRYLPVSVLFDLEAVRKARVA